MQIAIDGPAGAGKSTVARALAAQIGVVYLDTGAMFRAIALGVLEHGLDPEDAEQVASILPELDVEVRYEPDGQHTLLNGRDVSEDIRSAQMGLGASSVAKCPAVRDVLRAQQRNIAERHDIVMDGRDIGSFVLPNADYKFFLTASSRARAERRYRDLQKTTGTLDCTLEELEQQIRDRDEQDMTRAYAPLQHTADEILVDTSDMTQAEVVRYLADIICNGG